MNLMPRLSMVFSDPKAALQLGERLAKYAPKRLAVRSTTSPALAGQRSLSIGREQVFNDR